MPVSPSRTSERAAFAGILAAVPADSARLRKCQRAPYRTGPTIIDVFLERPAILTPLADDAAAIVANYGCSDRALLDALFARVNPTGRLPIGLPQSMDAVHSSPTDQPLDSTETLFARGARIDLAIPHEDAG